MKRLCLILVASTIPVLSAAAPAPDLGNDSPPVSSGQKEVDQVYFVQGTVETPLGTFKVDLKVTTCKQGTSGCTPS